MALDFHEIRFPLDISLGSRGGPRRRTDIVTLASGREQRNARWAHSLRRYDAGLGVRTLDALAAVIAFFEERRGRLYGFRFRDRADALSCAPSQTPGPADQRIGTGDGATLAFQLVKTYGAAHAPYERIIAKPVAGSVRVAVGGVEQGPTAFACDPATGLVTFAAGHVPATRRRDHRRLRLRRAGPLRPRRARHRPLRLRGRRDPADPARRDRHLKPLPEGEVESRRTARPGEGSALTG